MARTAGRLAILLIFSCAFASPQVHPSKPHTLTEEQSLADFNQFWTEIAEHYVYLGEKSID